MAQEAQMYTMNVLFLSALALLAFYLCMRITAHARREAWPTVPGMLVVSLLWFARWVSLLAEGYDEFVLNWRRRRDERPIRSRCSAYSRNSVKQSATPIRYIPDNVNGSSKYAVHWQCFACSSKGKTSAHVNPNEHDALLQHPDRLQALLLDGARQAHFAQCSTSQAPCIHFNKVVITSFYSDAIANPSPHILPKAQVASK